MVPIPTRVFAGSIPALLRPLSRAADLRALRRRSRRRESRRCAPARVLETAAGTGIVTRRWRAALAGRRRNRRHRSQPADARFRGGAARRRACRSGAGRRAAACRFADGSFDVGRLPVRRRCSFPTGLPAIARRGACCEPGGRFLFSVWDRIEENEFTAVVTDCGRRVVSATTRRGFSRVRRTATTMSRRSERELRRGRVRPNRDRDGRACAAARRRRAIRRSDCARARRCAARSRRATPTRLAEATDAPPRALAARFGPGPIDGKIQAHVVTASR